MPQKLQKVLAQLEACNLSESLSYEVRQIIHCCIKQTKLLKTYTAI